MFIILLYYRIIFEEIIKEHSWIPPEIGQHVLFVEFLTFTVSNSFSDPNFERNNSILLLCFIILNTS